MRIAGLVRHCLCHCPFLEPILQFLFLPVRGEMEVSPSSVSHPVNVAMKTQKVGRLKGAYKQSWLSVLSLQQVVAVTHCAILVVIMITIR
jgi:hypothetical protein